MSAVLSPCGTYRYRLEREVPPSLLTDRAYDAAMTLAVIMVNPSTADAVSDDATIRKVLGFAARLGVCRVLVGNKFAFRATDIKALRTAADPIGPENDRHLRDIILEADLHVVAWGPLGKLPPALRSRWRAVTALASGLGCKLHALDVAQDGHPKHPLMLGYSCQLRPWISPDALPPHPVGEVVEP